MTDAPLPDYPAEAIVRLRERAALALARDEDTTRDVAPDDLAALLDYVKAGRWRPIESAPKDGTHILVGTFPTRPGDITIATAHWFDSRAFGAKSGNGEWALSVNFDGEHSNHGVAAPSHWRPLPSPPDREG